MTLLLKSYFRIPMMTRLTVAILFGCTTGLFFWYLEKNFGWPNNEVLNTYISPFGLLFVNMLKMIVLPVVFFTLLEGSSSLPLDKFGKIGAKIMILYLATSFVSASVGIGFALIFNPGKEAVTATNYIKAQNFSSEMTGPVPTQNGILNIIMDMFVNPFEALARMNFLAVIVFTILFGLALNTIGSEKKNEYLKEDLSRFLRSIEIINRTLQQMVSWILEYAPIGVFALSLVNFTLYGPTIVGTYLKIAIGIIFGILFMIFGVYGSMVFLLKKENPLGFFMCVKEAMLTAFITRSSAAALPVSIEVAVHKLKVKKQIASFGLPLGATVNMDGVCVHLPMFAILAGNIFGIDITFSHLLTLVISTVLAAIGAGGIPGGSLMLLFLILGSMGLSNEQTTVIVAIAMGVNPILDMFETMNNVTGDLLCTYVVDEEACQKTRQ